MHTIQPADEGAPPAARFAFGGATPSVLRATVLAMLATAVLLGVVAVTAGVGVVGWIVALAAAGAGSALIVTARVRSDRPVIFPADWVTLTRALFIAAVAGLVADSFVRTVSVPALVTLCTVALVLDAVDGRVARRSGTVSELGARFDMEVDAFLILVLSVHVAVLIGPWVLAIGAMRYVFVAASWLAPWLRATLPPRYSAKVVAAGQGITLVVVTSGVLPRPLALAAVSLALALLSWSFGRDVRWLWRHRRPARSGLAHAARAHAYK